MTTYRALVGSYGMVLALLAPVSASAQDRSPPPCGTSIPGDEATGFVPIPRGTLFCPLLADPKEPRSFLSFQHGTQAPFDTRIGAIGIGDSFGIVRWGGPRPGEGFQINAVGSVFAQFDLATDSYDLINADYLIGVSATLRRAGFSSRIRLYHQSSHLGDEYLLRDPLPQRENLAFESLEVILSQEVGGLRLYAGGERLFNREPADLAAMVVHGGAELRQIEPLLRLGQLGSARMVAGVDVKSAEEQEWKPSVSARAGLEVGRPRVAVEPSRRWQLLAEVYDGPTPFGQFFREKIRYYGLGLHFSL